MELGLKPYTLWAQLWQAKYANGSQWHDLIRINPTAQGSLIWNNAKTHSKFIQDHSFWEVHSGQAARFWDDSWQQLPKLSNLFHKPIWHARMKQGNITQVHQFWQQTPQHDFQTWKPALLWQPDWQGEQYTDIEQELANRKIRQSNQQDKLRWGYTTKGIFTTKEAHLLRYSNLQADKDKIWGQIWHSGLWPKVSTFLWLLSKKRILTWDNIIKRGLVGPSRCPNCNINEESISHLMETCPLAQQL